MPESGAMGRPYLSPQSGAPKGRWLSRHLARKRRVFRYWHIPSDGFNWVQDHPAVGKSRPAPCRVGAIRASWQRGVSYMQKILTSAVGSRLFVKFFCQSLGILLLNFSNSGRPEPAIFLEFNETLQVVALSVL